MNCPVIGLLYARVGDQSFLRLIQVKLIDISSNLSTLDEQKEEKCSKITEGDVNEIEGKIDEYEEKNEKWKVDGIFAPGIDHS